MEENIIRQIEEIDKHMKSMQQELLITANSSNTYDDIGLEIRNLRDKKQELQNTQAERRNLEKRINEMMNFLNELPCGLTEYQEEYVRILIEKVMIYDTYINVEFKSGITVDIFE